MQDVPKVSVDEVTPLSLYFNRRRLMRAGLAAGTAMGTAATYRWFNPVAKFETSQATELQVAKEQRSAEELLVQGWRVNETSTVSY